MVKREADVLDDRAGLTGGGARVGVGDVVERDQGRRVAAELHRDRQGDSDGGLGHLALDGNSLGEMVTSDVRLLQPLAVLQFVMSSQSVQFLRVVQNKTYAC